MRRSRLASMAAKYVRELFMQGLNDYFAARIDGLQADGRLLPGRPALSARHRIRARIHGRGRGGARALSLIETAARRGGTEAGEVGLKPRPRSRR